MSTLFILLAGFIASLSPPVELPKERGFDWAAWNRETTVEQDWSGRDHYVYKSDVKPKPVLAGK